MHHSKNKNLIYLILVVFLISCEGEVGPQGTNSLTNVTTEPAGANCENGGVKIEVGIDNNVNGILDTDEILSTSYVCNGTDGAVSLTIVTTEPAGTNCENGGIKIKSGVDTNGDGTLDDSEISATAYVCNGIDGNNSLTKITNEAAGTNCENGGLKIDSGVDTNSDGTLDDSEISATAYVCNGIDGNNSLTKITNEAAGTNCENGGLKIDSGIDANSDGTLDDSEISATAYVCNGIDGNNSLTKITNEAAGTNCENGGLKIDSGVDTNSDGTLDDSEISATAYVCNGIDGNNSLTKITNEAAGTNCENGGLKIDSGIDANSDGTLDDSEISATAYVCNGIDGEVSLVNITDEIAGTNCENGGVKIESGIDGDKNGTLDTGEIQITRFICNGLDGGFDEQIRFNIVQNVGSSSTTPWFPTSNLFDFNINDYVGVDSVIFVAEGASISDASAAIIFDLYDLTNNASINNSRISTNSTTDVRLSSGNLFQDLPNERIDLGVGLSTDTEGIGGRTDRIFLFLYRRN